MESTELCNIFLMLQAELKDLDIPHCTTIHTHVEEVVAEHPSNYKQISKLIISLLHQLTNFCSDVYGLDFRNNGSLDIFEPYTIHGHNYPLDSGDLQGDD